jgi:hypothetical protein
MREGLIGPFPWDACEAYKGNVSYVDILLLGRDFYFIDGNSHGLHGYFVERNNKKFYPIHPIK